MEKVKIIGTLKEEMSQEDFSYSQSIKDREYEYRTVTLPQKLEREHRGKILPETQWREMGIRQSHGWEHYAWFMSRMMFRRKIGTDPSTGIVNLEAVKTHQDRFDKEYPPHPAIKASTANP